MIKTITYHTACVTLGYQDQQTSAGPHWIKLLLMTHSHLLFLLPPIFGMFI